MIADTNNEQNRGYSEKLEEIERLMELKEDRLYSILGNQLAETTGTLYGPAEAIKRAREWLIRFAADNRKQICQFYVTQKAKEGFCRDAALVSSLAEFLLTLAGYPGGFTVAVLLVMRELDILCDNKHDSR